MEGRTIKNIPAVKRTTMTDVLVKQHLFSEKNAKEISEFKHFLNDIDDSIRGNDPCYSQHHCGGGRVANCSGVISTLHTSFATRDRNNDAEDCALDQTIVVATGALSIFRLGR